MDRLIVKRELIQSLSEIQSYSGGPVPKITGATRPIEELDGFDSYNAVEVAVDLSVRLDCEISLDVALFENCGYSYSVDETVALICEELIKKGRINHE